MDKHAIGNLRVLTSIASELLVAAARLEADRIDEKLYFECFGSPKKEDRRPGRKR